MAPTDVVRRELGSCALAWKVVVKGPWWGRGEESGSCWRQEGETLLEAGGRNQVDWPGETGGRWPMHQVRCSGLGGRPRMTEGQTGRWKVSGCETRVMGVTHCHRFGTRLLPSAGLLPLRLTLWCTARP